MDFQSINPFNVRLNLLSGNLLPMANNSSFSTFWKIYSICLWLIELYYTVTLIAGCFFVPIQKAIFKGLVVLVIIVEASFTIMRIHTQTALIQKLIRKLNDILNIEDENIRNIVITNIKPIENPFKFYLVIGTFSISLWYCVPISLIFEKNTFYYSDFHSPGIYSKEPFSISIYLLGTITPWFVNIIIFVKKVSVDVYITNLITLITAQYQYIASKFVLIFQNCSQQNHCSFLESNSRVDSSIEREIKNLCRQHNNIVYITLMLKKLLSLNIVIMYLNNVIRFCAIGIFTLSSMSTSFVEGFMAFLYGFGSIVQFYILCNCFQKLADATSEITDKAFHEDWNRFNLSVKRIFMMVILASHNMDLRISLLENFNLSLPSFMSILNRAYSIALLLLRMK